MNLKNLESPQPGVFLITFDKKYNWPWGELKEDCMRLYDMSSMSTGERIHERKSFASTREIRSSTT
jgi:hypothetical protein